MRALLVRSPWIEKILEGKKTWEIRGSRTTVRGPIGLIRSGSGKIIGLCDVVDCIPLLSDEQFRKNARKAGMNPSDANLGFYKNTFAWVLANPKSLKVPVYYKHPNGAVIWIKLDGLTERAVRKASLRG